MTVWLNIITLAIQLVGAVAKYLGDANLLDAGKAKAISEGLKATLDNVARANEAANEVTANPDGDFANSVRDKYTRKDGDE